MDRSDLSSLDKIDNKLLMPEAIKKALADPSGITIPVAIDVSHAIAVDVSDKSTRCHVTSLARHMAIVSLWRGFCTTRSEVTHDQALSAGLLPQPLIELALSLEMILPKPAWICVSQEQDLQEGAVANGFPTVCRPVLVSCVIGQDVPVEKCLLYVGGNGQFGVVQSSI